MQDDSLQVSYERITSPQLFRPINEEKRSLFNKCLFFFISPTDNNFPVVSKANQASSKFKAVREASTAWSEFTEPALYKDLVPIKSQQVNLEKGRAGGRIRPFPRVGLAGVCPAFLLFAPA